MQTFFKSQMTSRPAEKRERAKAKLKAWVALRKRVLTRDGYKCVVCRKGEQLDVHHVVARSAGGKDESSNLASVCRLCHCEITLHKIWLTGNADRTLRITR